MHLLTLAACLFTTNGVLAMRRITMEELLKKPSQTHEQRDACNQLRGEFFPAIMQGNTEAVKEMLDPNLALPVNILEEGFIMAMRCDRLDIISLFFTDATITRLSNKLTVILNQLIEWGSDNSIEIFIGNASIAQHLKSNRQELVGAYALALQQGRVAIAEKISSL